MYLDEFKGGNTYCETSSFDHSLFSEMKNKNKQRHHSLVTSWECLPSSVSLFPLTSRWSYRYKNGVNCGARTSWDKLDPSISCLQTGNSLSAGVFLQPGPLTQSFLNKLGLGRRVPGRRKSQSVHSRIIWWQEWLSQREEFTFDRAVISDREKRGNKWSLFVRAARQTWARNR